MPSSRDRFVRGVRGLNPPELGSGGGRGRTGWGMDWDVEAELESIPVLPSPPQSMPAHQQEHPARLQRGWMRSISSQRLLLLFSLEIRNSPRAGRWEHSTGIFAAGDLGRRGGTSGYRTQRGRVVRRKELGRNDVTFHQLGAKLKTQSSRSGNPEATRR